MVTPVRIGVSVRRGRVVGGSPCPPAAHTERVPADRRRAVAAGGSVALLAERPWTLRVWRQPHCAKSASRPASWLLLWLLVQQQAGAARVLQQPAPAAAGLGRRRRGGLGARPRRPHPPCRRRPGSATLPR